MDELFSHRYYLKNCEINWISNKSHCKLFPHNRFSCKTAEILCRLIVSVEITEIYSHTFFQNFVKATFLLKKLLNSWFDEFFSVRHNFSLCVREENISHLKIISWNQSTATLKYSSLMSISRNFWTKMVRAFFDQ